MPRAVEEVVVVFFKQKTAYEMRISDWSSDVCSSDLTIRGGNTRSVMLTKRVILPIVSVSMEGMLKTRSFFGTKLPAPRNGNKLQESLSRPFSCINMTG